MVHIFLTWNGYMYSRNHPRRIAKNMVEWIRTCSSPTKTHDFCGINPLRHFTTMILPWLSPESLCNPPGRFVRTFRICSLFTGLVDLLRKLPDYISHYQNRLWISEIKNKPTPAVKKKKNSLNSVHTYILAPDRRWRIWSDNEITDV